jgi:hypothetical protein
MSRRRPGRRAFAGGHRLQVDRNLAGLGFPAKGSEDGVTAPESQLRAIPLG